MDNGQGLICWGLPDGTLAFVWSNPLCLRQLPLEVGAKGFNGLYRNE